MCKLPFLINHTYLFKLVEKSVGRLYQLEGLLYRSEKRKTLLHAIVLDVSAAQSLPAQYKVSAVKG